MLYRKFDKDGYYVGQVHAEYNEENPQPDDVTDVPPPQPMYKVRFDREKNEWIETATPPDYDSETEIIVWDMATGKWVVQPKPEAMPTEADEMKMALDILLGVYDDELY